MPVLDWTRTDLEYVRQTAPKRCVSTRSNLQHLNCHPEASRRRSGLHRRRNCSGRVRFATMSDEDKARLTRNIIAVCRARKKVIPSTSSVSTWSVQRYRQSQTARKLCCLPESHIPVAEEVGVRMAVHPDDPPPRSSACRALFPPLKICSGWLYRKQHGERFHHVHRFLRRACDNDLVDMIKQFGPRIYFTHRAPPCVKITRKPSTKRRT